jgi:hypothetical protein
MSCRISAVSSPVGNEYVIVYLGPSSPFGLSCLIGSVGSPPNTAGKKPA